MHNLVIHTSLEHNIKSHYFGKYSYRFFNSYDLEDNTDRLTLVGIPNEEAEELAIGIAFCTYPDNFSRKKGVEIATKRAKENPYMITSVENFSVKSCLTVLDTIHDYLCELDIDEVKKLINKPKIKESLISKRFKVVGDLVYTIAESKYDNHYRVMWTEGDETIDVHYTKDCVESAIDRGDWILV